MSSFELYFYLVASLVMLGLTVWSMRTRDLERGGKTGTAWLFGVMLALFFVAAVSRAVPALVDLSEIQRVAVGLTAGSLSAGAVLMFLRARHMRRSAG